VARAENRLNVPAIGLVAEHVRLDML
jgi:hypothetical protein